MNEFSKYPYSFDLATLKSQVQNELCNWHFRLRETKADLEPELPHSDPFYLGNMMFLALLGFYAHAVSSCGNTPPSTFLIGTVIHFYLDFPSSLLPKLWKDTRIWACIPFSFFPTIIINNNYLLCII